jgi:sulfane dehydrogenase subunit SoxC
VQERTAAPAGSQRPLSDSPDLTLEELQLAARNHGMPLEALRYPVTPIGLHYLLTHYDIPSVDVAAWRLRVGGLVRRELALSLDEIHARPRVETRVTMECAGNGRALLGPRPVSQPWLVEAVGTGEWGGTPLRPLLEEAGLDDAAAEVLFTVLDRGVEGEVEQSYERSLPVGEALREEVLLAYELNGQPLPPQHGFPLRLVVPCWYGMASVKWVERITVLDRPFDGYQQRRSYRLRQVEDE